ncbi:MAG TPA: MXAN_5808 family serine peptidase, partial [Myxococcaceae bacterium]|nr:MXAN_5808 family serine peptidase [Myxococcaceae bacterium]
AGDEKKQPHDLSAMRIFSKVIIYVKENYVDPKRVHPKEMMVASLEAVEKTVPDVMVDGNADTGHMKLNVNGKLRDFDISHVDSLWKMSFQMKDVFEFIGSNLRPSEDTRDVEYAAVNGMLSTLDPHSVLLKPEYYREMRLTTKGEFGGLGFVIQMKESNLTVVRVLPKTPASRAGIKKDDQIKKIGEESTVNMDLNEAVSKLRGPVDSRVTITVERKAADKPMVLTLARATISIESVQSKLLAGNVGYIRLKNFQGNTTRDMQTALGKLASDAEATGGLKGLVLDLRGNPGGLLEQAIQVSDLFLSQGTIVTTVSLSERQREEKRAHADDGDNKYPLAVLVNPGSASASEIVAGALKNLNRAVIIGQQTFGKGSVQVLYEFGSPSGNPNDESALKLTIAKYLTPGDVSIQEVGIEPDIELVPTRVTADRVNVFAPRKTLGEADLEHHFGNSANNPAATKREEVLGKEKPFVSIRYLKEDAKQKDAAARQQKVEEGKDPKLSKNDKDKGQKLEPGKKKDAAHPLLDTDPNKLDEDLYDQLDAEAQDEVKEDFEVLFARDFVLKEPFVQRDRMLQSGKGYLQERGLQETERINTAIAALGVDWAPGPTPKAPQLLATLRPGPEKRLVPGDSFDLEVTAENKGSEPLSRIRAWTESEDPLLDRREFVFGTLKPGEKRTWKVPVKVPKDMYSRRDDVTVRFLDDQGTLPQQLVAEVNFGELPRPAFALDWQVVDDCAQCNGDGVAQRGESVTLLVDVTNQGTGKALDAVGSIKNAADQNIFIEKGRFHLGEIAPGETKTARFQLEVKRGYVGDSFPLKLAIIDEPLEEFSTERLNLPLSDRPYTVEARKGAIRVEAGAPVLAGPDERAPVMARVKKAGVVPVLARVNGLTKVETEKGRFGFVRASDAHEARNARAAAAELAAVPYREPPQIVLQVDQSQGGVVAPSDRYTLSGTVSEPKGLLDMYVLVNDRKVFFRTSDSPKNEPTKLKFSADFPLKEGANSVMVVARQTQDFASRKVLIIRRRPAAVAQALARAQAEPTVRP